MEMFVMRCTRLVLGVGRVSSTLSSLDWLSSRMVSFRVKSNLFRDPPWSSGPNWEAERGMASWSFQAVNQLPIFIAQWQRYVRDTNSSRTCCVEFIRVEVMLENVFSPGEFHAREYRLRGFRLQLPLSSQQLLVRSFKAIILRRKWYYNNNRTLGRKWKKL